LLRAYEPTVEPISDRRGGDWPRRRRRTRLLRQLGPEIVGPPMNGWDASVALPGRIYRRVRQAALVHCGKESPGVDTDRVRRAALRRDGGRVPDAVATASVVVAIGGGYLTDIDRFQTERTLDLLECAADRGIPTVLTGQGIGPLAEPDLLDRAAQVLPRVDLISLRENVRGPELLRSLGVPDDRVVVSGDDAVELGYSMRRTSLGDDLGVCLRVAEYSPVGVTTRDTLGRVVREAAADNGADLVPLIVSEHDAEDRKSTLPLLDGYPGVASPLSRFASARALSRQVGTCRIIVTGAYHVAVFALSQGIPVVGLSSSEYYDDKFAGLKSLFGDGVRSVRLDSDGMEERLREAIRLQWLAANELRSPLLERAQDQIVASREVFSRIADLVEHDLTRRRTGPNPSEKPTYPM
jgi:polysaccharide pyruvyl transferase WcaK-like protein